jgi:hypothetical protein
MTAPKIIRTRFATLERSLVQMQLARFEILFERRDTAGAEVITR